MATTKAQKELEKINSEIAGLNTEIELKSEQIRTASSWAWKYLTKERNALYTKLENKEIRKRRIESNGISTSEESALKKEIQANASGQWTTIARDRDLGSRQTVKIGRSEKFDAYIKATITRWNGFMRNVKGCASLADTSMVDWTQITKEQYEELLKGKCISRCFNQTTENEITIGR